MAKRRGNDEGSVYQSADGVWYAQLPPDEQGKRPKRRAKTQKEAIAKLRELQQARKSGINLTDKIPTFAALAQTWLNEVTKRRVRESTYNRYAYDVASYLGPTFGDLKVTKITTPLCQQYVNRMDDDGYAIDTIKSSHSRLSSILDLAVDYRYIVFNPAKAVRLPRKEARAARAMTRTEIELLFAAVVGDPFELAYHLMITLGTRRGETLGASWRGVDWDAATLKIDQQVIPLNNIATIVPVTKTPGSTRTLPIPPLLLARLREQWNKQQILRRGKGWKEYGLILTDDQGGPLDPSDLSNTFPGILVRLGIEPVRIHDLRHTCASLLGELGTMPHVVSSILGHSPKTMTERYTHPTLEMMREALERHEAKLFREDDQRREGTR